MLQPFEVCNLVSGQVQGVQVDLREQEMGGKATRGDFKKISTHSLARDHGNSRIMGAIKYKNDFRIG